MGFKFHRSLMRAGDIHCESPFASSKVFNHRLVGNTNRGSGRIRKKPSQGRNQFQWPSAGPRVTRRSAPKMARDSAGHSNTSTSRRTGRPFSSHGRRCSSGCGRVDLVRWSPSYKGIHFRRPPLARDRQPIGIHGSGNLMKHFDATYTVTSSGLKRFASAHFRSSIPSPVTAEMA